jgi:OmpA-OmpF porin, OOP family
MIRRAAMLFAVAAMAAAPAGLAQSDTDDLPSVGLERAKVDPGDLVVRLGFTFGRADVPATVRARLDQAAAVLANERTIATIEVAGHTDAVGSEEYNQRLSEQRAQAVKDYLVERGVAADRISVVGYGESQPRSTNDTIEGRRLNRRVEVRAIG